MERIRALLRRPPRDVSNGASRPPLSASSRSLPPPSKSAPSKALHQRCSQKRVSHSALHGRRLLIYLPKALPLGRVTKGAIEHNHQRRSFKGALWRALSWGSPPKNAVLQVHPREFSRALHQVRVRAYLTEALHEGRCPRAVPLRTLPYKSILENSQERSTKGAYEHIQQRHSPKGAP